ncbi:MAG: hypothetical protein JSR80_02335 [Verrucomicrobia bacterium]|nr:hypothetical protein [Verrucomicrobiota bacterium]
METSIPLKPPHVPLNLWKQLYWAAAKYQALLSCKALEDGALFAARDPLSGDINYCYAFGEGEEVCDFSLLRGREGLETLYRIQDGEIDQDNVQEVLDHQNALFVEFCEQDALDEEDLRVIKALGPDFSKRALQPQFRSFLPGYMPWHLTADEVRTLTSALQCAVLHLERCMKDPDFKATMELESGERHLLYTPQEHGTSCSTSWHELKPSSEILLDYPLNPQRVAALKEIAPSVTSPWEISAELAVEGILCDRDRPYFLKVGWIVDEISLLPVQAEPIPLDACPPLTLCELALTSMEELRCIPSKILVRQEKLHYAFQPFVNALGIDVQLVDFLPGVDTAQFFFNDKLAEEQD